MKINSVKTAIKKKLVIACAIISYSIVSGTAFSQNDSLLTFFKTGIEPRYGFIIPHNNNLRYLVSKPVFGIDITLSRRSAGEKEWQKYFRNPASGFGLHYINFGSPDYFGSAFALYAMSDFYFSDNKNGFLYHLGYGVSYLTRPFDEENNYYNVVIGSHVNVFFKLALSYSLDINNVAIKPFVSFIHYSNGSFYKPNLGINIANTGINIGIPVKKQYCHPYTGTLTDCTGSYSMLVTLGSGLHQKSNQLTTLYPIYTIRAEAERKYSYKHSWGAGADITYYRFETKQTDFKSVSPYRCGVFLLYNTFINRFIFSAQSGAYIYNEDKEESYIFSRFGLSYSVTDRFRTGVMLKSHFFVADFVELSVTYIFYRSKL